MFIITNALREHRAALMYMINDRASDAEFIVNTVAGRERPVDVHSIRPLKDYDLFRESEQALRSTLNKGAVWLK
jgi:hypothetical protein